MAYTRFSDKVTCESDLIALVKKKAPIKAGGEYYHGTTKEKIGRVNRLLVYSFWLYNKTAGIFRTHKRHVKAQHLDMGYNEAGRESENRKSES